MRKRVKPPHIAAGALAMTFAVVLGANVLPSRGPDSTPPQPLKPTLPETLATQPPPKSQRDQHAGGPYTFARELEAQPQLAAADTKQPLHLGGAALNPHRDSQTLRSAPRLTSAGPTGGATLRSQQHHDSQPQQGTEPGNGSGDKPQGSDETSTDDTKPTDDTAGPPDANPTDPEQAPDDQNDEGEPDQPPTLPVNPLPTQPGTPDGSQPPAAEVPEPSSLALLSLGLLMLGVLRRRARR